MSMGRGIAFRNVVEEGCLSLTLSAIKFLQSSSSILKGGIFSVEDRDFGTEPGCGLCSCGIRSQPHLVLGSRGVKTRVSIVEGSLSIGLCPS